MVLWPPPRRESSLPNKLVFSRKISAVNTNLNLKGRTNSHLSLVWILDKLRYGFKIDVFVGRPKSWRKSTPILRMFMKPPCFRSANLRIGYVFLISFFSILLFITIHHCSTLFLCLKQFIENNEL